MSDRHLTPIELAAWALYRDERYELGDETFDWHQPPWASRDQRIVKPVYEQHVRVILRSLGINSEEYE